MLHHSGDTVHVCNRAADVTQDGVATTGVSVAFTIRAMDAGPVLVQQQVTVDPNIQAPQLLSNLFQTGTR